MRSGFVFFLILEWCAIFAQKPAYLHYGVQDGLPGNLIYCGLQDHRGLLWFGTDKGLACFDGMRFRVYSVADGLPDPEVLSMHEDQQGRLWLFCFRKKPCYMLNGRIITETEDNLLANMEFSTSTCLMTEANSNSFWLTELGKRAYFVKGQHIKEYNFEFEVASVAKFGADELILGLQGIYRFKPDGSTENIYTVDSKHSCRSIKVNGNRILYSYNHKTVLLEWSGGRIQELVLQSKPVGQLSVDAQNRFWICAPGTGAVLFDNDRRDLSNPVVFLPGKKVTKVFEDAEGTFWFCTADEGVFALQPNAAIWYQKEFGFKSQNIRTIARDPAGQILVGDDIGTIHVISENRIKHAILTGSEDGYNQIRQILPTQTGSFRYGSDESLGYYSDNYTRQKIYVRNISIKGLLFLQDTLWWASATSLSLTTDDSSQQLRARSRFTSVEADSEGMVWGGKVDGLFSRRDSFNYNWGDQFPALKSRIIQIRSAGNRQIWVVTPNNGLLLVHVRAGEVTDVEIINENLSSPIVNIQQLFVESNGMVWMATNKGVCGLYPNRRQTVRFSTHDGLIDDDVNAVLVHQDTLWACTVSGLTRIILKQQEDESNFPSLVTRLYYEKNAKTITCHLLDSLPGHHQITLPAGINNLQLELSALDYRSRRNFNFEIIQHELLLPVQWWTFDNLLHWVASGFKGRRDTTLRENNAYNLGTFLPPGKYNIQVTAIKSSKVYSLQPDTWTILKPPFWYQLIWLQLLAWGVVLYVFWRIYHARRAFQEIQATASALQLQALQAQMNPHFIGNAINAIQQFLHPPDPEKTSEYISVFMRLLRRTMHFSEQTLVSFEEELDYNKEYLQLTQLRFEDRFKYKIIGAEQIPPETPVPSMLIQPVLENATLHGIAPTGEAILNLEFKIVRDQFFCILTDNGIGFKATQKQKKLAGIKRVSKGLSMLNKKIKTLNRLYNLDLKMNVQDLNDHKKNASGTRVTLCYSLSKTWKLKNELPPTIPTDE